MRKILAITAIVLFFCPYFARADTAQIQSGSVIRRAPSVDGWNIVNTSRIELIISDQAVAYLGLEVEYNNPNDTKEFVRVIRRHIPLIISRHKREDNVRLFREAAVRLYVEKEENDKLSSVSSESDPILYVKWRMKDNPLTGRMDMLDGNIQVWFMGSNGEWIFVENMLYSTESMTENINSYKPNGKPYNVFSGIKYKIGDVYHIIRIDRSILESLADRGRS